MEWNVNFTGEKIPKNIKNFIDNIPEDLFYPKETKIIKNETKQSEFDDFEKFVNNIKEPDREELIKSLNILIFPEISLINELKERNKSVLEQEDKKRKDIQKEEEEKTSLIIKEEIKKQNEQKERQKLLDEVENFIHKKLYKPTETLLHDFYDPNEDSNVTPQILYYFERTGTFLHQKKEVINEEAELKKFQQEKTKEIDEDKIDIDIEIPKNLPKDPIELRKTLEKYDQEKKNLFKKLEQEMKDQKFKILMELQNYKEIKQNNEWKEYIDLNFVKPNEKDFFTNLKPNKRNEFLDKVNKIEEIKEETQKITFQFQNPIFQDDLIKTYIKSKL